MGRTSAHVNQLALVRGGGRLLHGVWQETQLSGRLVVAVAVVYILQRHHGVDVAPPGTDQGPARQQEGAPMGQESGLGRSIGRWGVGSEVVGMFNKRRQSGK